MEHFFSSKVFYSTKRTKKNLLLNEKKRRSLKEYRKRFAVVFFPNWFNYCADGEGIASFRSLVGNRILSVQYRIHLFSYNYFVRFFFASARSLQYAYQRSYFEYDVCAHWLTFLHLALFLFAVRVIVCTILPFRAGWSYNAPRMQLMVIFNSSFSAHSFLHATLHFANLFDQIWFCVHI